MRLKEIKKYILSDLYRYTGKISLTIFLFQYFKNRGFKYTFWLRLSWSSNKFIKLIAYWRLFILRRKSGIDITPRTKIGYGLYLGHGQSIVVSDSAIIGNNCNLSQFTTIGTTIGKAANIGNNVYIGPSVCIIDDVKIEDNVSIGAGSVVNKDIPKNATSVGVPAKIVNYNSSKRFIMNPWPEENRS